MDQIDSPPMSTRVAGVLNGKRAPSQPEERLVDAKELHFFTDEAVVGCVAIVDIEYDKGRDQWELTALPPVLVDQFARATLEVLAVFHALPDVSARIGIMAPGVWMCDLSSHVTDWRYSPPGALFLQYFLDLVVLHVRKARGV